MARTIPFIALTAALFCCIGVFSLLPALGIEARLWPADVATLTRNAQVDMADLASPRDPRSTSSQPMRESLERAIRAAPLNARHISLLGLVAERAGDVSRAREMMAAAARLSHRDTVALDG